jgi:serine/threonine-protein kinase
MALLALLALAGDRGHSRDKLMSYLWPDRDAERARLLLNQAVYSLRKALGDDALLSVADDLRLNLERVEVDVVRFEAALERGDHQAAVALYHGPLLDGLFLSDSVEFERWADRERVRLADRYAKALEALADAAESAHDSDRAVHWWKARAAQDPHDSRVAIRLMQALASSGNRAGALQHADIHARLLQEEFGAQPAAEVTALAERLRTAPASISIPHVNSAASSARVSSTPTHSQRESAPAALPTPVTAAPRIGRPPLPVWLAIASLVFGTVFFAALWAMWAHKDRPVAAKSDRSIAVLPLANQSVDPRDSAWADGMTDALTAILAKNSELRVISSTSAFAYRNRRSDVRSIADSLGVANVLEGGVQKDGTRLRVRVRLLDARDGSSHWSETYDRELRDAFAVQDEIANAVARELGSRLGASTAVTRHREPTTSIAAYELYMHGMDRTLLRSDSAARMGVEYFRRAIALDSTYAGAWAGLARLEARVAANAPRTERYRQFAAAEEAARKAISLDDSLAEGYATLGAIQSSQLKLTAAEQNLARAIELDPSRALTHQWMSHLDVFRGRSRDALAHAQRALDLDPLSPDARADFAAALIASDRCDEALTQLKPLFALQPPLLRVTPLLVQCYARKEMWQEAVAVLRSRADAGGTFPSAQLGYVLARSGQRDEALRIQTTLLERWRRGESGAIENVIVAAGLGELDQAFDWLNRSIDDTSVGASAVMIMGPMFEDLRRDPRFNQFRERLGIQNR